MTLYNIGFVNVRCTAIVINFLNGKQLISYHGLVLATVLVSQRYILSQVFADYPPGGKLAKPDYFLMKVSAFDFYEWWQRKFAILFGGQLLVSFNPFSYSIFLSISMIYLFIIIIFLRPILFWHYNQRDKSIICQLTNCNKLR